ncbi:MAG: response regulator transcription factor [Rhodobacteraceae bacterium]|nr:response regulator transcription factor [Paracoccaceae bacterium]
MVRAATVPEYRFSLLIADDHHLVSEAFAHLLEQTGRYSVTIARDALEARAEIHATGGFDLVLLDLNMPGMDGPSAVEDIVRANAPGRVAVLTGGTSGSRQSTLFCSGVVGLILKSQPAKDILDALDSILDGELYFPRADDRSLIHAISSAAVQPQIV